MRLNVKGSSLARVNMLVWVTEDDILGGGI